MKFKKNKENLDFSIYLDETKTTSGQRFWCNIANELKKSPYYSYDHPDIIYFNLTAPFFKMVLTKIKRKKVILRLDTLYMDRLSNEFISSFKNPLIRCLFKLLNKNRFTKTIAEDIANFINRNYGGFIRILFADFIVYQSKFAETLYSRYFPNKPHAVILNGSFVRSKNDFKAPEESNEIRLITIFDPYLMAKRMNEIVRFVKYANEEKKANIYLTILGYNETQLPNNFLSSDVEVIKKSKYILTYPKFKEISLELINMIENSHAYISFAYRDCCPNVIIESMSCGVPVVGIGSGGVSEIVGNAGELIIYDDFSQGFFSSMRFENSFPEINFEEILNKVIKVANNNQNYRNRVKERFENDLEMKVVAIKYIKILKEI